MMAGPGAEEWAATQGYETVASEALVTDPHPGFASEIMNELRKLLGIREHEKAAPREKSKTVDVESRHNNLKKILTPNRTTMQMISNYVKPNRTSHPRKMRKKRKIPGEQRKLT